MRGYHMTVVRFTIPRAVADAIQIANLSWVGQRCGVEDLRFTHTLTEDECAIICSRPMAACLLEGLMVCTRDPSRPAWIARMCADAASHIATVLARGIDAAKG